MALSRITAWLALSLTIEGHMNQREFFRNVCRWMEAAEGLGRSKCRNEGAGRNVPLPFDHFFFCFLPADAAAGA